MIQLENRKYDIVGSIVLYDTPNSEIGRSIDQFLAVDPNTHLCVIDNSPSKTRFDYDPVRVSYHHAGSNLGYGKAHNIALRAARDRSRYSLVMNTDVVYSPDAILELYRSLEHHSGAALAAPKLLYPDGSLQCVCRLLPTPTNLFLRRFLHRSRWAQRADEVYELRFWDHESPANLPYFQGSFLMIRTALANAIGGFDERFRGGPRGERHSLREAGRSLPLDPAAHRGSGRNLNRSQSCPTESRPLHRRNGPGRALSFRETALTGEFPKWTSEAEAATALNEERRLREWHGNTRAATRCAVC